MSFGAELATLFVRLRPNTQGFAAEATAGVKRAMSTVTEEVNASAKANIAATQSQITANKALIVSYQEIAAASVKGSDTQILASKAATDAQIENNRLLGASLTKAGGEASALKRHVLNIGSALGLAFGADIAVKTIKDLSEDAAAVQKSTEAIRAEFGSSGNEVVEFGEKGAHALNIYTHSADQASARFGILFKNIGIGHAKAAEMTIGFEQLVGALAKIRGIDPTPLLQNVALAAAGNTRGLKQLGIVVDNTSIKYAALKYGLISSITQGITPAIKAQAIYKIATANLPEYLDQAAKHSRDLTSVQRQLSVQWDTAKETLGRDLLPIFSEYVGKLADYLTKMNNSGRLQHDFQVALHDIGATIHLAETFLAPLVATFKAFGDVVGGTGNELKILAGVFIAGKLLAHIKTATTEMLLLKAAAGPGGAAGGAGKLGAALGKAGLVAEVGLASFAITSLILKMTGLDKKLRSVGGDIYDFLHKGSEDPGTATSVYRVAHKFAAAFETGHGGAGNFKIKDGQVSGAYVTLHDELKKRFGLDESEVSGVIEAAHAKMGKVADGVSKAVKDALPKAFAKLKPGDTISDKTLANQLFGGATFNPAKATNLLNNLLAFGAITSEQYGAAADKIVAKVKDKYGALTKVNEQGVNAAKFQLASLNQSLKDAVAKEATDLQTAIESARQNLDSLGQSLAASIGTVLDKPIQDAQAKVQAATDKLSLENIRRSAVLPGGKGLSTDPVKALAQLKHLEAGANSITRGAIVDFTTKYQAAYLAVKQDQVNVKKDRANRSIADLTDSFKRGEITAKQFQGRLGGILKADLPGYKKIGNLLGTAMANGIRDNVKSLFAQAQALVGVPGGRAGGAQIESKIVKPLDVLHRDQREVAHIQAQIFNKHGDLLRRIAKANEKAATAAQKEASILAQIRANTKTSRAKNPGDQSARSTALNGTKGLG